MTLPDGWAIVPVSDLSSKEKYSCVGGPFGSSLTRKDYVEYEGVPISRGTNLKIGSRIFIDDEFVYVSEDKAKKLSKHMASRGDIILTQRGTIGQVAIIPNSSRYERYILSQNQMKITLDKSKVNPLYFLYYFLSNKVQNKIQQIAIGGVIPGFNLTQFREFEVLLPTLSDQDRIVSILDDLDKKIELNSQTNQTLEQISQAIFKSWFVDFEPTNAKIAAREVLLAKMVDSSKENNASTTEQIVKAPSPEKIADAERQAAIQAVSGISGAGNVVSTEHLETLADLFPNQLVDSELGEIPEGWRVNKVKDVVHRLKPSQRFTKKQIEPHGKIPVYEQGAKILLGYHNSEAGFNATPDNPIFIFGDHTCVTHLSCEPFDISSNVIPLEGKNYPTMWVFNAIKDIQQFQEYRRHWSELIIKEIICPSENLAIKFSEFSTVFAKLIESNASDNSYLSQTRDYLLPKLLSGELPLEGHK